MPRRRGVTGPPIGYVVSGSWPHGDIDEPAAGAAQEVSRRLADAIGGRSFRSVSELADVNHTTISDILAGTTWPDFVTLAKLAAALDFDPWPRR